MQASWGAENGFDPRGAELYGEKGRYVQSAIESLPWYASSRRRRIRKVG